MNDTRFVNPDAAGIDYPSTIPAPRRSAGPGSAQSREDPTPLRCEHAVSCSGDVGRGHQGDWGQSGCGAASDETSSAGILQHIQHSLKAYIGGGLHTPRLVQTGFRRTKANPSGSREGS